MLENTEKGEKMLQKSQIVEKVRKMLQKLESIEKGKKCFKIQKQKSVGIY